MEAVIKVLVVIGAGVITFVAGRFFKKQVWDKHVKQIGVKKNEVQQKLLKAKEEAKIKKDPKFFSEARKQIFEDFKEYVKTYQFTDPFNKLPGHTYHLVMGMISAGKSSLLKQVTGVDLAVGVGETTKQLKQIHEQKSGDRYVNIFDAPGINQDFSIYAPQTLLFLYGMDQVFVIYRDSLKNIKDLLEIIHVIKPKQSITLIRTHCDLFNSKQSKTCAEEIKNDYLFMETLKIQCRIFAFSSQRGMDFMDNKKVANLILGKEL